MKLRTFAITLVLLFVAASMAFSQAWIPLVNQPDPNLALTPKYKGRFFVTAERRAKLVCPSGAGF